MAICTICGLVTEYLKQHMSNHGDERNFACDKCEKVCQCYKQLMNHKKSHMTWNCTNCDQVIPHNSRSIHLRRCKNESNVLSCEKCPYITNDKSNLNKHMKTHAIKEKPTFECEHCAKVFQEKKYLNQHRMWKWCPGVYGEELSRSYDSLLQEAQSFKNWGRTWG